MDASDNRLDAFRSLKKDILQLITKKIFLGRYTERRYVESLQAYRDIIIIESNEDIVEILMQVKKALETYAHNKWIGITDDPQNSKSNDCLLWVQLTNVPVGKHWFQMSAVSFKPKEIILEVEYVQPFRSPDRSFNSDDPNFPTLNLKEIFTYQNMYEVIKFSAFVFLALSILIVETLKYVGESCIKLSYVIISLIEVSIPIWLGMFEFLSKCVGGFFWLIYVLIRGTPDTPFIPGALLSNRRQAYKSLEYRQSNYPKYKQEYSHNSSNWNKHQRK